MTDDPKALKTKGKKTKDGDDEMTVVVPPPKKQASNPPPPPDADGDVAMDDEADKETGEVKVDPSAQAVSGMLFFSLSSSFFYLLTPPLQT